MAPAPLLMHVGNPPPGSAIVFTTLRVLALIRETVAPMFVDHAEPKANATSHGFLPTKMRFVTFIVAGFTRRIAFW